MEIRKNPKKGPKFISLKKAAKISNYHSDYIGWLIRMGRIEGKKTSSGICWKTTRKAILAYNPDKVKKEIFSSLITAINPWAGRYISLKEAEKISGYSSNYIGWLIRTGKVPGKKALAGYTWLTTERAISEYQKSRQYWKNLAKRIVDFLNNVAREKFGINLNIRNSKNLFGWRFIMSTFFILLLMSGFSPIRFFQGSFIKALNGGETKTVNFYSGSCLGGWQNFKNAEGPADIFPAGDLSSFSEANSAVYKTGPLVLTCDKFDATFIEETGNVQPITETQATSSESISDIEATATPTTTTSINEAITAIGEETISINEAISTLSAEDGSPQVETSTEVAKISETSVNFEATTTESATIAEEATTTETTTTIEEAATVADEATPTPDAGGVGAGQATTETAEPLIQDQTGFLEKFRKYFGGEAKAEGNGRIFQGAKIKLSLAVGKKGADISPLEIKNEIKQEDNNQTSTQEQTGFWKKIERFFGLAAADAQGNSQTTTQISLPEILNNETTSGETTATQTSITETLSSVDARIVILWSVDGEKWNKLDNISSDSISNALNNGYFTYDAPFLKNEEDIKNLKIKVEGNFGGETDVNVYLDSVWVEMEYQELPKESEEQFEIKAAKKDWKANETPEFEIVPVSKSGELGFVEKLAAHVSEIFEEKPKVKAKLDYPKDKKLGLERQVLEEGEDFTAVTHSPTKITIFKPEDFQPGLYKLKIDYEKDGKIFNLEQDFTWGVLAVNVNKSIYLPNEQAYLQMGVLDEQGRTLCDAELTLEITSPDGVTELFSTPAIVFEPEPVIFETEKSEEIIETNIETEMEIEIEIETESPETIIDSHPDKVTNLFEAEFNFHSNLPADSEQSYQCRTNNWDWGNCESPKKYSGLTPGDYTFEVFVTDSKGKYDLTPAVFSWTITKSEETSLIEGATTTVAEEATNTEAIIEATSTLPAEDGSPQVETSTDEIQNNEKFNDEATSTLEELEIPSLGFEEKINKLLGISAAKAQESFAPAGVIQKNSKCGPNSITDIPDYYTFYNVKGSGNYQIKLTAVTKNGTYSINDSFEVKDSVPFDVERAGPTRIYPLANYEMILKIKVNQDFNGEIAEPVPDSFKVLNQELRIKDQESGNFIVHDSLFVIQEQNDGEKKLIWQDIDLKQGNEIQIKYTFDAPNISPEFYLLGPLSFQEKSLGDKILNVVEKIKDGVKSLFDNNEPAEDGSPQSSTQNFLSDPIFSEIRQWQIASDITCGFGNEIGGGQCRGFITTVGESKLTVPSDWSASNTIEVIGGGGAGATGSSLGNGGGGAGAYAIKSNLSLASGNTVYFQVAAAGGDTWFNDTTATSTTCGDQSVCAKGGLAGSAATGGKGGTTTTSVGDLKYAGGNGGNGNTTGDVGGGGGGAAGPAGAGCNGETSIDGSTGRDGAGGGGGGGNLCTAGGVPGGGEGYGGDGYGGNGGGEASGAAGTAGTAGGGAGNELSATGGAGATGSQWGTNYGSGGGGGGSGNLGGGGGGGKYGGGGGGGEGTSGAGAQGIIVITYTPFSPTITQRAYIFENDDGGTVNSNSDLSAVNSTSTNVKKGQRLAARFQIDNTGDSVSNSAFKLQYDHNDDVWANVDSAGAPSSNSGANLGDWNAITIDSGSVGQYMSITIGADSFPVISYYSTTSNGALKVAKCGNAACSAGTTTVTIDSGTGVGQWPSLSIGTDGFPVISYNDNGGGRLKVAKCGDAGCTSGTTTVTINSGTGVGQYTSMAIGNDGLPVISYYIDGNGTVNFAKCGNAACSAGTTTVTIDTGNAGKYYSSIAIGTDGNPVISYYNFSNNDLLVAKCGNSSCSSGNTTTTVESGGLIGDSSSIAIGTDGFPVISYDDQTNGDLKVAKCGNAACSAGNTLLIVDNSSGVSLSTYTSLAIGTDGWPVVAYNNITTGALKVAKMLPVVEIQPAWGLSGSSGDALTATATVACSTGDNNWQNGAWYEGAATSAAISLAVNKCTELAFMLDTSEAVASTTYRLRLVTGTSTALDVYTQYPAFSIATEASTTARYSKDAVKTSAGTCTGGSSSYDCNTFASSSNPTSLAIGTDGNPVIAYHDGSGNSIIVTKCGNSSCSSGNTTVTVAPGDQNFSLAIGTDGFPVISYYYSNAIRVAKCLNAACTSTTTATVESGGVSYGYANSLAIDNNGFPVIAYYNSGTWDLKLARCGNAGCNAGTSTAIVDNTSGNDTGRYNSITIGTDGLPVIVYADDTPNFNLMVAKCNDVSCSSNTKTILDSGVNVFGRGTSIAIGTDGFPVIVSYDSTAYKLKVYKCGNAVCNSGNITSTIDDGGDASGADALSLAIGTDGNPVISYYDNSAGSLKVTTCGNISCSSGTTTVTVDDNGNVGRGTSLAIGNDGRPVIAYNDISNTNLKIAKGLGLPTTAISYFNRYIKTDGQIKLTRNLWTGATTGAMWLEASPAMEDGQTYWLDDTGYTNVSADDSLMDNATSTGGTATTTPIFVFTDKHATDTNSLYAQWIGQSNIAASSKNIYLQIYRFGSTSTNTGWEGVATDTSSCGVDTDCTITGGVTTNLSQYYFPVYKFNDSTGTTTPELWSFWRVYQAEGVENLKTDQWSVGYTAFSAAGYSISGVVFSDEGSASSTQGSTVSLVIDGVLTDSTAASAVTGAYSFSNVSFSSGSTTMVFINNNPLEYGVTITRATSSSITRLDIYKYRTIVRHEDSGPITLVDLDKYDSTDDLDIPYTSSAAAGTFTGNATSEFYVFWSSTTFSSYGTNGVGGAISFGDLDINGTFTATSTQTISDLCFNSWTGASCWDATGGTFNSASSTVQFTSTASEKNITANGSPFWNLTFDSSGGIWTFQDAATTSNDLAIKNGTASSSNNMSVYGGDVEGNGTLNWTGGTFLVDGTGYFGGSTNWTFNNLTFGNSVGTETTTASSTNSVTVNGTSTVNTNQTFTGSKSFTVNGGNAIGNGTFNLTGGTFLLDGNGNFGGTENWTFNNLTFGNGAGFSTTTAGNSGTTTILNILTIAANQELDAGSKPWVLSGSSTPFSISGIFSAQTSLFKYNSTSSATTTATTYYNLELSPAGSGHPTYNLGSGTLVVSNNLTIGDGTNPVNANADTFDPTLTVNGNYTISANATATASQTGTFNIAGNWSDSGKFIHSTGTVTFIATSTGKTITTGGTGNPFYNLTFNGSGGGWTFAAGNHDVDNNLTITQGTITSTANTLNVGGNWLNLGRFNNNSGTVLFDATSTGKTIVDGGWPFYLITFNGTGGWLYQDGTSTAPATTTVQAGTAVFLNAKTGDVSVTGGELDVDWYLGVHVVDAATTSHNIDTGDDDITASSSGASIWAWTGFSWDGPYISTTTGSLSTGKIPDPSLATRGAIRIREYSRTGSATSSYKYNLMIAGQTGIISYNYYNDYGTKYLTSTSSEALAAGVDKVIWSDWHRNASSTMNTPYSEVNYPPENGSWYIGMTADLEISVDSSSVIIPALSPANNYTATNTNILTATTSYSGGYTIKAYGSDNGRLKLGAGEDYIIRWPWANSSPAIWSGNCQSNGECGFGYTTSDNSLGGGTATRFNNETNYAGFALTSPGDPVADSDSQVSAATTTITYKVSVNNSQSAGQYSATIYYIATANY